MMVLGQANIRKVHVMPHDAHLPLRAVDVMYSEHMQTEGHCYILNPPVVTHSNKFLTQRAIPPARGGV
jgi:hypothetical protein